MIGVLKVQKLHKRFPEDSEPLAMHVHDPCYLQVCGDIDQSEIHHPYSANTRLASSALLDSHDEGANLGSAWLATPNGQKQVTVLVVGGSC